MARGRGPHSPHRAGRSPIGCPKRRRRDRLRGGPDHGRRRSHGRPARRGRGGAPAEPGGDRSPPRRRFRPSHHPGVAGGRRTTPARRRAADVALLERLGALRARPGRSGRCAHAPGGARHAGARHGWRCACRERDDSGSLDRPPGDGGGRRSLEPTPRGVRDPRRADRRADAAGLDALGGGRLRGVCALRPGRGQSDDAAGTHPGRRVAARALQRARRARGRHQSVHVRVRAVAGRRLARLGRRLRVGPRSLHGAASGGRRHGPARPDRRAREARGAPVGSVTARPRAPPRRAPRSRSECGRPVSGTWW